MITTIIMTIMIMIVIIITIMIMNIMIIIIIVNIITIIILILSAGRGAGGREGDLSQNGIPGTIRNNYRTITERFVWRRASQHFSHNFV